MKKISMEFVQYFFIQTSGKVTWWWAGAYFESSHKAGGGICNHYKKDY